MAIFQRLRRSLRIGKAPRPGRNDPCWCGSGKKYKNCHARTDGGHAKTERVSKRAEAAK